jgi:hypothetical protein
VCLNQNPRSKIFANLYTTRQFGAKIYHEGKLEGTEIISDLFDATVFQGKDFKSVPIPDPTTRWKEP